MATYNGGGGSDTIQGSSSADIINGFGGNDLLYGNDGADILNGAGGNDYLSGGAGNDILVGGVGVNDYLGGAGNDTFRMMSRVGQAYSDDLVYDMTDGDLVDLAAWGVSDFSQVQAMLHYGPYGAEIDAYYNGTHHYLGFNGIAISQFEADDFVYSTAAGGTQTGTALEDVLFGSAFADTLNGGDARDKLLGGGGADVLNGGNGNDDLIGGGGADNMTGGDGYDWFIFNSQSEVGIGAARDVITDFVHGVDMIDLSGIDANALLAGDQCFTWIGSKDGFTAPGQLRFGHPGGNTLISGNTDGDADAEFQILIIGNIAINVHDFFL